jgi:hypothetical protein
MKQSSIVLDCFAEPVIGPRSAWTRRLAMTVIAEQVNEFPC